MPDPDGWEQARLLRAVTRGESVGALVAAVERVAAGEADLPILTALRRTWPPEVAGAALRQARLRGRGRAKFGDRAGELVFTADGLEQATRPLVAERRARRYTGHGRVVDLCCGIGSDTLALAAAGLQVLAVDSDPVAAQACTLNAETLGVADRVEVRVADATTIDLAGWPAVFCDPARRRAGRRVFDPHAFAPPWAFLTGLAARVPAVGLKLAPGLDHALIPAGAEAEWVSVDGDVVEAALWFGALAGPAGRRATLLPGDHRLVGPPGPPVVGPVGDWLYEPDGAVIRAGLVSTLAARLGARLIDPRIAYLSADERVPTAYATAYRVIDRLPFGLKRLRAALRVRGVGVVTIKKRGSPVEPEWLRGQLRLSGPEHVVVVLTRVAGAPTALLCRPPGS